MPEFQKISDLEEWKIGNKYRITYTLTGVNFAGFNSISYAPSGMIKAAIDNAISKVKDDDRFDLLGYDYDEESYQLNVDVKAIKNSSPIIIIIVLFGGALLLFGLYYTLNGVSKVIDSGSVSYTTETGSKLNLPLVPLVALAGIGAFLYLRK